MGRQSPASRLTVIAARQLTMFVPNAEVFSQRGVRFQGKTDSSVGSPNAKSMRARTVQSTFAWACGCCSTVRFHGCRLERDALDEQALQVHGVRGQCK